MPDGDRGLLQGQIAVAVAEQDADGVVSGVGGGDVQMGVAVEIARGERVDPVAGGADVVDGG